MYQGMSDRFLSPHGAADFRALADDIDFEAEFAVITDHVPLGVGEDALSHIRLITLMNDWSLRAFGLEELKGGFGFIRAKPYSALAAIGVTPDELGEAWRDGRIALKLRIERNGQMFGQPDGGEMSYGFDDLIRHAATTRPLCSGTIIGSGTVSNALASVRGSGCIGERRALDTIAGRAVTPYLSHGESVGLECRGINGENLFGSFVQAVDITGEVPRRPA
jgi:fumarylacetoacetate (FAA) hydrolase